MIETGVRLNWREPLVADKHCIGGIPGNRTSMLIVPIVAAHGMLIPKTSSRAITSPAGTADTMEVLSHISLSPDALNKLVRLERGCLAWGGTTKLAPVDDVLISVERPLGIDSQGRWWLPSCRRRSRPAPPICCWIFPSAPPPRCAACARPWRYASCSNSSATA
ncbi:hypothetical protein [Methylogaea oryzae]|uniref:hypothetical protein n=1 Tax=Methylogaea oryzae TaxID=1295382 RepID=UPI000A86447A|nr:hypothetical protein [Methylogaea oryzae]